MSASRRFARKVAIGAALVACCLLGSPFAARAGEAPKRDGPASKKSADPAMVPVEDVARLPRVLLLGDSISIGYTVPVRELLKGKANVHRALENCGWTARGIQQLGKWLGDGKWDVIHFNFGLHDLKYADEKGTILPVDKGKQLVPPAEYEKNLGEIVARLKQTGAKLIWCTTTPVPEGTTGRVKDAEVEYNRVAEKIMKENGVAINDLHALATARQAELQLPKNVHFTAEGSRQLARQVAASIEAQWGK
jgi:acyl-CoA thioesterase-1